MKNRLLLTGALAAGLTYPTSSESFSGFAGGFADVDTVDPIPAQALEIRKYSQMVLDQTVKSHASKILAPENLSGEEVTRVSDGLLRTEHLLTSGKDRSPFWYFVGRDVCKTQIHPDLRTEAYVEVMTPLLAQDDCPDIEVIRGQYDTTPREDLERITSDCTTGPLLDVTALHGPGSYTSQLSDALILEKVDFQRALADWEQEDQEIRAREAAELDRVREAQKAFEFERCVHNWLFNNLPMEVGVLARQYVY